MSKKLIAIKWGVHLAVAVSVDTVTRHFVAEHTEMEADSIPAHIIGGFTGEVVAMQTDKLTVPAIEIIAAKLSRNKSEEDVETPAVA